jgi:hypothetical protein
MATLEATEVEMHPNGQLVFNVRVRAAAGRMEFPVAVQDQGSRALNETAVFRSALGFAEELAAAIRLRLGSPSE